MEEGKCRVTRVTKVTKVTRVTKVVGWSEVQVFAD